MQIRSTKLFGVLTVAVLALALFAGNALADTEVPAETSTPENGTPSRLTRMMDAMGQETWGEMIQHMTQIHGPELTGQMLQWMSSEDMPCDEDGGPGHMMGHGSGGMMSWRFNGSNRSGAMMGNALGR